MQITKQNVFLCVYAEVVECTSDSVVMPLGKDVCLLEGSANGRLHQQKIRKIAATPRKKDVWPSGSSCDF